MKLCSLFLVFLLCTTTISSFYLTDDNDASIDYPNLDNDPFTSQSFDHMQSDRMRRSTIVKRSQRNANILYRYCRRNGQAPNFCLKYAVRMIFATGH